MNRHLGLVDVSHEYLVQLFPDRTVIQDIRPHPEKYACWRILFDHPDLPAVGEGGEIPLFNVEATKVYASWVRA